MEKVFKWSTLMGAALVLAACGSKDQPKSLEDIASEFDSPSGTVSETTAADVARALEDSENVPTQGAREQLQSVDAADVSVSCQAGGKMKISTNDDASEVEIEYKNCCMEASCCVDGVSSTFASTTASASYDVCAYFDITSTCDGETASANFSYCSGVVGLFYLVEVNGGTFAVSGSTYDGTGTLTIRGENGSWTCQYTDYSGTCESSTGDSFSF